MIPEVSRHAYPRIPCACRHSAAALKAPSHPRDHLRQVPPAARSPRPFFKPGTIRLADVLAALNHVTARVDRLERLSVQPTASRALSRGRQATDTHQQKLAGPQPDAQDTIVSERLWMVELHAGLDRATCEKAMECLEAFRNQLVW